MCGISGVFDPTSPPAHETLSAMNDCLIHRGPDGEGIYREGPVGFAHRRLSIIDPNGGQQPLSNEDESVVVIFNGEIYNHQSLREELTVSHHRFETDADTEVLVHGYEEWGDGILDRVEGMFALALWDTESERLLLARDRRGIKPLYLAKSDETIAFASELPALFEAPLDLGGLDRTAIAQYFGFGFIPAPNAAFKNVEKLSPGEKAIITSDGIDRTRYYTPSIQPRSPGFETAARELQELVETSVEKRLMSDVPLGAFLSGGIDSSIIVGIMSELRDDPVQTFTVGFDEHLFDESWAAREVADYHGTDHHKYTVSPDDVRELIPDVIDRLGEPFADPSLLPTYVVARETSQEVTVALSGDGADELFAGYNKYLGEQYSRYYRAVPSPIRSGVEGVVNRLPARRDSRRGELIRQTQKFVRGGEEDPVARHFEWLRLPDDHAVEAIGSGFSANDPEHAAHETLRSAHDHARTVHPDADDFTRMLVVDTDFVLPNQMLTKVDLAGMFNSLEARVPFLDTAVVEYAMSLPLSYKIDGRNRKRVLKHAFDDLLPSEIQNRSKQGFDVPVGEWFKGPLADEFHEVVESISAPFIDTHSVLRIYREHCNGHREHGKFLWSVYVYGRWERQLQDRGIIE